jgi:hypothetical protein
MDLRRVIPPSSLVRHLRALVLVAASMGACDRSAQTNVPESTRDSKVIEAVDATQVAPGERLLYLPEGDARGLLGREVTKDAQGHTVIAEARRPGCTAEVIDVPNAYAREYERALSDAAGLQANVRQIAELEGHYRRGLRLQLSIDNVRVLRANLVGDCGPDAIAEVNVGRGRRRIVAVNEGGGTVAVDLGALGGGEATGSSARSENEALSWETPQAWAVRTTRGDIGRATIEIAMPERVAPGQQFVPKLRIGKPLWIVVLYRDAEGHHGVLLPRGGHSVEQADGDLALPPLVPSNLPGHVEDRETLLVYGFTEEADYALFRPPAGAIATDQADAYAASLQARLRAAEIPPARWVFSDFTYLVAAP